jgi:hypothetical protein
LDASGKTTSHRQPGRERRPRGRRHDANDCFLEDLGSTNGTRVNGAQVRKRLLRTNDVIELGKYKLTFVDAAAAPAVPAAADYDKTMVWRPPGAKQDAAPAGAMPAGATPAGAARGAPSQAGAEQDATRKPIWKVGLVVLVILVIVFFTYGMRG